MGREVIIQVRDPNQLLFSSVAYTFKSMNVIVQVISTIYVVKIDNCVLIPMEGLKGCLALYRGTPGIVNICMHVHVYT